MQRLRRWSLVLLVGALASFVGSASAQGVGLFRALGAELLYEQLRERFASERDPADPGPQLLANLYLGLEAFTGQAVPEDDQFQVCVELVGTGTTPRLDGGGGLLTVRSSDQALTTSSVPPLGLPRAATDLVIVDEFDLLALTVSLELHRRLLPDNLLLTGSELEHAPHWSAFYGFRLAIVDPPAPETTVVPHGHLVAFHALAHFGVAAIEKVVLVSDRHAVVTVASAPDPEAPRVRVHLLDVDFDDVATIRDAVQAIPTLGDPLQPTPTFAVLSWGLVDCALSERYTAHDGDASGEEFETLAEYLEVVFATSDGPGAIALLAGLCEAFEDVIEQHLSITCDVATPEQLAAIGTIGVLAEMDVRASEAVGLPQPSERIRYFAAAGNQGMVFPMPPAAWPGVIGVEACTGTVRWRDEGYSNRGTTSPSASQPAQRARGAYFASPESVDNDTLVYWGTSFAAPSAAVHSATDTTGKATNVDPEDANWCD